jgi:hypothetical protein
MSYGVDGLNMLCCDGICLQKLYKISCPSDGLARVKVEVQTFLSESTQMVWTSPVLLITEILTKIVGPTV